MKKIRLTSLNTLQFILVAVVGISAASCSKRIAYTEDVRKEYDLDADKLKRVQFYTSSPIILQKSTQNGNTTISEDGKLIASERSTEDRLIINPNTKCVFEKYGEKGEIMIRFEPEKGKTLSFAVRQNQSNGRYYLVANWKSDKGGEVQYGTQTYYANSASGNAYLVVSEQKLKKKKRKDKIVKGIKV